MKKENLKLQNKVKVKKLTKKQLETEIKNLPEPSFNNPEKVQPKVIIPEPVNNVLSSDVLESTTEQNQKILDQNVIISKPAKIIENLKRSKKTKILLRVAHYVGKNWIWLALTLFFAIANSVSELLIPIFLGKSIDAMIGPNNVLFDVLLRNAIYLLISAISYAVCRYLYNLFDNILSYKTAQKIRIDLFKKLNNVPLKYIDGTSHGDLQSRMINDVEEITSGFLAGFTTLCDSLFSIILVLTYIFTINVPIASTVVGLTPISLLTTFLIVYKSNKHFRKKAKALGDLSGEAIEMLGNQKVVLAFNYQEKSLEKFNKYNNLLADYSHKAMWYSSISNPVARLINGLIYALVAVMGAVYGIKGIITVGEISVLLSYANKYIGPFNDVASVVTDVQTAYASAKRVFNVLDIQNEPIESQLELETCDGSINLENVDFSYKKSKPLLQNLNVKVAPGQMVAIVGPTGCGKSTLINLLMRFYDINKGDIMLGDTSIYSIKRSSLREKFGMVLQDSWLFSSTIKENICYGKPDATEQEMIDAAKRAYAHEFIQTLPEGYNTVITESGENLSQGQRQLICIARIMLTNPPMLILDEATSNIDTRTELYIQNAFNTMMQGRTSFIVAHRLSTIIKSDIILVMNKGNIIEQGTHKELMEKQGFYFALYNSQFSKL